MAIGIQPCFIDVVTVNCPQDSNRIFPDIDMSSLRKYPLCISVLTFLPLTPSRYIVTRLFCRTAVFKADISLSTSLGVSQPDNICYLILKSVHLTHQLK